MGEWKTRRLEPLPSAAHPSGSCSSVTEIDRVHAVRTRFQQACRRLSGSAPGLFTRARGCLRRRSGCGSTRGVGDLYPRITRRTVYVQRGVSYRVGFPAYPCPPDSEAGKAPPVARPSRMARPRLELGTPRFSVIHAPLRHLACSSGCAPGCRGPHPRPHRGPHGRTALRGLKTPPRPHRAGYRQAGARRPVR